MTNALQFRSYKKTSLHKRSNDTKVNYLTQRTADYNDPNQFFKVRYNSPQKLSLCLCTNNERKLNMLLSNKRQPLNDRQVAG